MKHKKDKKKEIRQPVAVEMSNSDIDLLKEIYALRSYSGNEEPLRRYIKNFLDARGIPYENFNGNLVGINHPGKPIISAHMDMVNADRYILRGQADAVAQPIFEVNDQAEIRLYYRENPVNAEFRGYGGSYTTQVSADNTRQQTSLGADDKNGIFVLLKLLEDGVPVNFVLTHGEECGMVGSRQIIEDEIIAQQIESCQYMIVIDRKNSSNIIGYGNKYCLAMDDRLEAFAKRNGYSYRCEHGVACDMDKFSNLIEGVNLSCGYYNAHSKEEYTNLNELLACYKFVKHVVQEFDYQSVSAKRIREFKGAKKPYTTTQERIAAAAEEAAAEKKKHQKQPQNHLSKGVSKGAYSGTGHKTTKVITATADDIENDCNILHDQWGNPIGYLEDADFDDEVPEISLKEYAHASAMDLRCEVATIYCPHCTDALIVTDDDVNEMADNDITHEKLEVGVMEGITMIEARGKCCGIKFDLGEVILCDADASDSVIKLLSFYNKQIGNTGYGK